VVVAGAVVLATGWDTIDPLVSILIALLIVAGSWRLLAEPVNVLMEAAPSGLDVREIGAAMAAEPAVLEIHDLHVWTVTSGFPALSAHLVVRCGADRDEARTSVEDLLQRRFGINHTTLQVVESSGRDDLIALEDVGRIPPSPERGH
jgi:cobalt-zinc-cadmium efflux system protein